MPATLKGSRELRRRLKAIKTVFKPAGRDWADETARIAQSMVPVRTGKTRASIRRRNASQKRATVKGNRAVNFIDANRLVALFFGAMGINEHAKVQVRRV